MPFTLAVDARDVARDHRGLGRYARAILREFAGYEDLDLVLVTNALIPGLQRKQFATALGSENFAVASVIPKRADAAWHPWNGIFIKGGGPHIVTIADVGPFRFPAPAPDAQRHQQGPFRASVQKAQHIITISEASKSDIVEFLGVDPNAISVTYPGVDDAFRPGPPGPLPPQVRNGEYFLFIGDPQEVRKNFATLYNAYGRAFSGMDGGPALAVLCADDPQLPGVAAVRANDDAQLRALYRGALATCVPALCEGFGLPVAESMACGTPVLCANTSSLPEVAANAAVLVDPLSVDAWVDALQRIAAGANVRDDLRERGVAQAAKFRWDRCAQETLRAIRGTQLQARVAASVARN